MTIILTTDPGAEIIIIPLRHHIRGPDMTMRLPYLTIKAIQDITQDNGPSHIPSIQMINTQIVLNINTRATTKFSTKMTILKYLTIENHNGTRNTTNTAIKIIKMIKMAISRTNSLQQIQEMIKMLATLNIS